MDSASTDKLFELGIYNKLEEITQVQRVGKIQRLKGLRTRKTILALLGMETASDPQSLV